MDCIFFMFYFALVGRKTKNTGGRRLQIPAFIKIILINYLNFATFSTAYLSLPLISFYKHFYSEFVKSILKISK